MTKAVIKRPTNQYGVNIVMVNGVRIGKTVRVPISERSERWIFQPDVAFIPSGRYSVWHNHANAVRKFAVLCYNESMGKNHD